MIRSMTGFGRCQKTVAGMDITVELKSVNHRYYEYSSRLQRAYGFLDDKLKSYLQKYVSRGKLEVFVYVEPLEEEGGDVSVNLSLARSYQRALLELRDGLGMADGAFGLMDIARLPDVLSVHRAPRMRRPSGQRCGRSWTKRPAASAP